MSLKIQTHSSPNHDARRQKLSHIILHYTDMETPQAALRRLCDPAAKVSAHYLLHADGQIVQMVEESRRAWHAGVSSWQGESDMNSSSIGIELDLIRADIMSQKTGFKKLRFCANTAARMSALAYARFGRLL